MKKKYLAVVTAVLTLSLISITAYAAPQTMPDGTVFDAEYYAQTYPDVVAVYGTDANALYSHYVKHGKAEGRKAVADGTKVPVTLAVPPANSPHKYYTGLTAEQAAQADAVAQSIAYNVLSGDYQTDVAKVTAAAQIVQQYTQGEIYGSDTTKYYRSPYGVFVAGVYTCAGTTRALGRVLDYMGYEWQHTNENQNKHQWCILTMDGQTGYADGMGGYAGYGEMKSGMKLPDGRTIYFKE